MAGESMRIIPGLAILLPLAACRQSELPPMHHPPVPVPRSVIVSASVTPSSTEKPATARVAKPTLPPPAPAAAATKNLNGILFEGISFDARTHRLSVLDQRNGPGSLHPDAASAAGSLKGIAAINAGYFTPEGKPLGLVVGGGHISGAWNSSSSLGSGIWHLDASGKSSITRRDTLGAARARSMKDLIQAGPMLVHEGRGVAGLEATKPAIRSLILWDGGTRWWIGRTSSCTLAGLGRTLADSSPAGWPVRHALNLDGGRSSDLWISGAVPGGPLVRRPAWNRPVRNFLILLPRTDGL